MSGPSSWLVLSLFLVLIAGLGLGAPRVVRRALRLCRACKSRSRSGLLLRRARRMPLHPKLVQCLAPLWGTHSGDGPVGPRDVPQNSHQKTDFG